MARMGRPPKYNNCLDLDFFAEMYFDACVYEDEGDYVKREKPLPLTITGLAMALDMDRETVMNYSKIPDFIGTVKRHKLKIENDYEMALRENGRAGEIFGLKNFGWKDKSEVDMNAKHSFESASNDELDNKIKALMDAPKE